MLWMIVPTGMFFIGKAFARPDIHVFTGDQLVADLHALGSEYVRKLVVLVTKKRDEGASIRIVFEPLDGRRHVKLATFEINNPVALLVPTAPMTDRHASIIVAAAFSRKPFREFFDWLSHP